MMKIRHWSLILLVLAGCKAATVTTSTAKYSEDLTVLRKAIDMTPDTTQTIEVSDEAVALEGHIGTELDSVLSMIAFRNAERDSWDGYTIQMYSGRSREEAYNARDEAQNLMLGLDPKIEYYQPNYRVKGGKFFDRLEAYRTYKEVKRAFPQALLLPTKMGLKSDGDN